MTEVFPDGNEIPDYYHCSQHILKLPDVQYPDEQYSQVHRIESTMVRLNEGDVEAVIWGLQRMRPTSKTAAVDIDKLVTDLRNNAYRIDYKRVKHGQYPRGSGAIESANKFICHVRMKPTGAWWLVINGNDMLRLRGAMYNGILDDVFKQPKGRQRRSTKRS